MIDYMVYCPSYKRGAIAMTHRLMKPDNFVYVVRAHEQAAYARLGRRLMVIPPKAGVKDISSTRNWILDHAECERIVMVDDDISSFIHLHQRARQKLSPDQVDRFIQNMFEVSMDMVSGLWGCSMLTDPMAYSINMPFAFDVPILGPFCGHIIDDIRYDQSLTLKEDYDYFLQKVSRYGMTVRANFFSYQCDHFKLPGGCQSYRTAESEREQQQALIAKWGSRIIRYNEKNPESVNMRIRL
jgi:hypothetical protein